MEVELCLQCPSLQYVMFLYYLFQSSDQVELSVFDLADDARWKSMSTDAVGSVCSKGNMPSWPTTPPLIGSILDGAVASNHLEHELRSLVYELRRVSEKVF